MGRSHRFIASLSRAISSIALFSLALATVTGAASKFPNADSATKQHISIKMTLNDLTSPGLYWPNDELRITVQVCVAGHLARGGDTYLTTNDRAEPTLCGIIARSGRGDYCNIDFPNARNWLIKAHYETTYSWPPRYVASQTIRVTVVSSTTTTERQVYNQPTVTTVASSFNQSQFSGGYLPYEQATVKIQGLVLSPEAGVVTFTDALGEVICSAGVASPLGVVGCSGTVQRTPPPNPVTATYSGTQFGTDDGLGTSYGPSSGSGYASNIP